MQCVLLCDGEVRRVCGPSLVLEQLHDLGSNRVVPFVPVGKRIVSGGVDKAAADDLGREADHSASAAYASARYLCLFDETSPGPPDAAKPMSSNRASSGRKIPVRRRRGFRGAPFPERG